ncbi:hypothetical protein [Calothrix sp. NIES-2098]|uniref:hypothetical protein n=1 Tax=Calothrix sp. NIES-2098 TaxID=1954171 RepID=UPI000B6152BD|nr:hypothetical protein NIES2098_62900 [Calothrix sp. NIES-2098]
MTIQSLTLSRKVTKSLSIASLVIASTFSLSLPSVAQSLQDLNLETSDFVVRLYHQDWQQQLYKNIDDKKTKDRGVYVTNTSPVQRIELTQKDGNSWLEIEKIILPPLSNLIFILFLVIILYFFIWSKRKKISELIQLFHIKKLGWGGLEVQFNEEVYFQEADENLLYLEAWKIQKDSLSHLHEIMDKFVEKTDNKDKIPVLKIELFPDESLDYQRDTLEVYLETLIQYASMKYVIFTESDKFKGYIDAKKLLYQIKSQEKKEKYIAKNQQWIIQTIKNDSIGKEIVSNINNYKKDKNFAQLTKIVKGIETSFIIKHSSNKTALEVIKRQKKLSLAVVDEEILFLGLTNQEIIATQILNHLMINH